MPLEYVLLAHAFKGLAAAHTGAGHVAVAQGFGHSLASPHAAVLWVKQYAHEKLTGAAKEAAVEQMLTSVPDGPEKEALRATLLSGGAMSLWDMVGAINAGFPEEAAARGGGGITCSGGITGGGGGSGRNASSLGEGADLERLLEANWDYRWAKWSAEMLDLGYAVDGARKTDTVFVNRSEMPVRLDAFNQGKMFFMTVSGDAIADNVVIYPGHVFRAPSDRTHLNIRVTLARLTASQWAAAAANAPGGGGGVCNSADRDKWQQDWTSEDDIPVGSTVTIGSKDRTFTIDWSRRAAGEEAAAGGGGGGGAGAKVEGRASASAASVSAAAAAGAGGAGGLLGQAAGASTGNAAGDAGFSPGQQVTLAGLSRADLNGKTGRVSGFDASKGRYNVELSETGNTMAIKSVNLLKGAAGASSFHPGQTVTLAGLSKADLNGNTGTVVGFDASKGRFNVTLSDGGTTIAIKPVNLRRA